MRVINLASGSDGNITYLENGKSKILLDMGLSCAETVKRLEVLGVNPNEINAILVSHEHSDHIKGVDVFSKKFNIPVYAHEKVWWGLDGKLSKVSLENRKTFDGNFELGDFLIVPTELPHDVKCYGYSFVDGQNKISILTDLGHINDRIVNAVKGSQIVYLEANYDREMLMKGESYPYSLKMRIDGPNGHLSNVVSAEMVEKLTETGTRQIILSHLSKENNTPSLAYNSICSTIQKNGIIEGRDIRIDVASHNMGCIFKLKD